MIKDLKEPVPVRRPLALPEDWRLRAHAVGPVPQSAYRRDEWAERPGATRHLAYGLGMYRRPERNWKPLIEAMFVVALLAVAIFVWADRIAAWLTG